MANDVSVTISGPLPLKPIGVDITFAVNTVPTCLIAMDATQSTILQDPDSYKRKGLITVTLNVKGNSVQFLGYFDGLSASQSVGGISYTAVLKGQAQLLLETDTLVPGLSPYGQNPFKTFDTTALNSGSDPQTSVVNIEIGNTSVDLANSSLAEAYKQLAGISLNYQANGGFDSLILKNNNSGLDAGTLKTILDNPGRQAKLKLALTYFNNLDVSSLDNLKNILSPADMFNAKGLINYYSNGPRMLWENMVDFYGNLGVILIPGNNSIIAVPNNGFITFPHNVPGVGMHSGTTNAAYPADYNAFSYNDNGYVDVGYVALVSNIPMSVDSVVTYGAYQGSYPSLGGTSNSSGASLLILEANPLIFQAADPYFAKDTNNVTAQNTQTGKQSSVAAGGTSIPHTGAITEQVQSNPTAVQTASINNYNTNLQSFGDNYAELKFFQARYGDRMGSISSRFNSNWCPGTVGTLFSRGVGDSNSKTQDGTGIWLDYFVQGVTHRVSLSAPNGGTATTSINFNCGRLGVQTSSVASDKLYNYAYGQVQKAQKAFLADIKATGS